MSERNTAELLAEWFSRWHKPLNRFLTDHYRVAGADINDVAQEAFLRILRYDRATLVESPKAYLFQVAANVANEWAVRSRSRLPHRSQWLEDLLAGDSPEYEASFTETNAEIARALNTLTARQRAVLKLHFGENTARAQIADQMGLSPRTVKRELLKSYAKLRATLAPDLLAVLARRD